MATTVYGEVTPAQLGSGGGSGSGYRYITAAYARQNTTGPAYGFFCGVSYQKGYGAVQAGSLVQVSITGNSSGSTSDVQIYKNGSLWFTALTAASLPNTSTAATTSVNYAPGTKTYAAGDFFDVYLPSTATLYFGVTLVFAEPGP